MQFDKSPVSPELLPSQKREIKFPDTARHVLVAWLTRPMWSDMGRPKCGKPLTLVLRQMDVQRQSDDQDAKALVSDRSKHTNVVCGSGPGGSRPHNHRYVRHHGTKQPRLGRTAAVE